MEPRIFMFQGRGTVVTGRLERGKLKKGELVKAIGYGAKWTAPVSGTFSLYSFKKGIVLKLRVKFVGIESYHKTVDVAEPGDQLGLLIKGVERAVLRRGICLVPESTKQLGYQRCEAKVN